MPQQEYALYFNEADGFVIHYDHVREPYQNLEQDSIDRIIKLDRELNVDYELFVDTRLLRIKNTNQGLIGFNRLPTTHLPNTETVNATLIDLDDPDTKTYKIGVNDLHLFNTSDIDHKIKQAVYLSVALMTGVTMISISGLVYMKKFRH